MKSPELLLLTNTFLLSALSIASLLISFFLKDLYQDYKKQAERVNTLRRELDVHRKWAEELARIRQEQLERLQSQLDELVSPRRNQS